MTLSENKSKPGEHVPICWEALSVTTRLQASLVALSAPLLHAVLPAQSPGRLVLGRAEGTAEMVDAGAVRLDSWCGVGMLPAELFFRRGRQSSDAGLTTWLRDGGAWRKAGLLVVVFSCQKGKVPGFPLVVLML